MVRQHNVINWDSIIIHDFFIIINFTSPKRSGNKFVYRLIVTFLSTEIFSKRRKIYTWIEEKPELNYQPFKYIYVINVGQLTVVF